MFEKTKERIVKESIFYKQRLKKIVKNKQSIYRRYATLQTGIKILVFLHEHYFASLEDLCKITGRSKRTVQRLLAALDESGVPLIKETYEGSKVCYRIRKKWFENVS